MRNIFTNRHAPSPARSRNRRFKSSLLAGLVCAGLASVATAQEVIYITGTVRDFMKSHPDFDITVGTGHVANNVALAGADNRPVFTGKGFRVDSQWISRYSNPIAPHLYRNANEMRTVYLGNPLSKSGNPTIDTFDSSQGPYGGANKGPAPTFATGSPMPAVPPVPADMPPKISKWERDGLGTTTVNYDIHCDDFIIKNQHTVQFTGHVRIVVRESFVIENFAKFEVLPDGFVEIWMLKDAEIKNNIEFNSNGADPSRLAIYNLGINDFIIENSAQTYMNYFAPNGGLHIKNNGEFAGKYTGKNLRLDNQAGFHYDTGLPTKVCGVDFLDTAGSASGSSAGAITSAATFEQWFTNVLGVNFAIPHTIALVRNASGIYEYVDNSFFPIDDMVFGNEGDEHNYNFTFTFAATFTYDACANHFFEFRGADDVWVYIDGKLAMDLGGVMALQRQVIEMDRLELEDGEKYTLHFYYAQRNPFMSVMEIRTDLPLDSAVPVTMTAQYD